ncbi:MAG: hypothetical protein JSV43_04440 [Methanobacteriota archaeon]|nr:MAG: hypothetical protein JSV43_04440 [Euryarchaeota archaeon]
MNDLSTFIIVNLDGGRTIPEELMKVLKENGWMMVKKDSIFALPWEKILKENNTNAEDLFARIENVRATLKKLRVDYKIRTMEEDGKEN